MSASLSRWWTERVAAVGDVLPLPLAALLLVAGAAVLGAGWFSWPAWWPRRLPGWLDPRAWLRRSSWSRMSALVRRLALLAVRAGRRVAAAYRRLTGPAVRRLLVRLDPRRRRRRRRTPVSATGVVPVRQQQPVVPPDGLADRFAAQGRYAEAVRERLRAMVRDVADHGVVTDRPGWTVTELADAAGQAAPAAHPALTEASGIFSEVWYGRRPARAGHDQRMRELAGQLRDTLGPTTPQARR